MSTTKPILVRSDMFVAPLMDRICRTVNPMMSRFAELLSAEYGRDFDEVEMHLYDNVSDEEMKAMAERVVALTDRHVTRDTAIGRIFDRERSFLVHRAGLQEGGR